MAVVVIVVDAGSFVDPDKSWDLWDFVIVTQRSGIRPLYQYQQPFLSRLATG